MYLLLIPCLLSLLHLSLASPFWLSAELVRVDWREGCLTTAGCSNPRFKILEDLLPLREEQSISWPVNNEHFVQEAARHLVTQWMSGRPEDVSLSCQVVGTDPIYGFPRVCDQTPSIRVFQTNDNTDGSRARRHQTTTVMPEDEMGKTLIEVRGKCFNATLTLQKHTERCPTCPDPSDVTFIGHELPDDSMTFSNSILAQLQGEDRYMHIGMLVLAGIAAIASAAFGCVLVVYCRQKKSSRQISVKPRYHPYSPALVKNAEEESRYDEPWCQNFGGYFPPKSDTTTTSPLESASSLVTRYNYRPPMTMVPPPQTRLYHHISPNSSIGAHDSGLESV